MRNWRVRNLVERVELPRSTANLIFSRCQPGVDICSTILTTYRWVGGGVDWLEQVVLNCYIQGMMVQGCAVDGVGAAHRLCPGRHCV
jgi:hypothetical protein